MTTPTSGTLPAATVPSSWVTYTDETASFRLSYPSDWEVAIGFDEIPVDEILDLVAEEGTSGIDDLGNITPVFGAGLPRPNGGFDPLISITVESLPDGLTADEYASADSRRTEETYATLEWTIQEPVRIGDRDGVLVRQSIELAEVDSSLEGRLWGVDLLLIDGLVGWTVSCGKAGEHASDVAADLETCEAVVRSFRPFAP